jgi:hypothetical protein
VFPGLGDPATHVFAISTFSTFKGPQYAPTPSKTALTTAPTQVIVRCILNLCQHMPSGSTVAALQGDDGGYAQLHFDNAVEEDV